MKDFYALSFLLNACISSTAMLVPLLAADLSISYIELGIIGMAYGLANLISFLLFGRLSDVTGRRRIFVKFGFLFASFIFLLHVFMADTLSMVFVRALAGFSLGIFYFPLLAFLTRMEGHKRKMGIYGGFGGLGWGFGYVYAGAVGDYNLVFISTALFLFLGFIISLFLPDTRHEKVDIPRIPLSIIKRNWRIYLSLLLRHTGAASIWLIFPIHLAAMGADKLIIGILLGLNPAFQLFTASWTGRLTERIREQTIIKIGYLMTAIVFLSYYLSTEILYLFPFQLLLAFSWGFIWTGSLIYLVSENAEKATSSGILGSVVGLSSVIGPICGGLISQFFGFPAVFIFAVILSLVSFCLLARQ